LLAIASTSGLEVAGRDASESEWFEQRLQHDPAYLTDDLLRVARPTRARDRFEPALGAYWSERALGFDRWSLHVVLGELEPTVYALVKGRR